MKNYILFKHPYVLIEDLKSKYQPIYKEYPKEIPSINFESPTLCSPFSKLRRTHIIKKKTEIKIGFCEICFCKYENYKIHIINKEHLKFAKMDSNYTKIDEFIAELIQENKFNEYVHSKSPCDKIAAEYFENKFEKSNNFFLSESIIKISWISSIDIEMNQFNIIMNKDEKNISKE